MGAILREDLAAELVKEAQENGGLIGVEALRRACNKRLKESGINIRKLMPTDMEDDETATEYYHRKKNMVDKLN